MGYPKFQFTTLQNLFDTMVARLLAQNERCTIDDEGQTTSPTGSQSVCVYRALNKDGKTLGCAVGLLFTDEQAEILRAKGENNGSVYSFAVCDALKDCGIPIYAPTPNGLGVLSFLAAMQNCVHDSYRNYMGSFADHVRSRAALVAVNYGLSDSVCKTPAEPTTPAEKPKKSRKDYRPGLGTKRHVAATYRAAAKLLEANPNKHCIGYGNPFADDPAKQCFCAIAAVDIQLKEQTGKPVRYGIYEGTKIPVGEKVFGFGETSWETSWVRPLGKAPVGTRPDFNQPESCIWELNDSFGSMKDGNGINVTTNDGMNYRISPEGHRAVLKALRRAARLLEHGGAEKDAKAIVDESTPSLPNTADGAQ
jgi:hypothetical protein